MKDILPNQIDDVHFFGSESVGDKYKTWWGSQHDFLNDPKSLTPTKSLSAILALVLFIIKNYCF